MRSSPWHSFMRGRCPRLRHAAAHRRAFTLVELLVVIAIIGILVALLLPAIQAAREAARRTQCKNNVKNLALAVLNFENAKRALPPSTQAQPAAGNGETVNIYNGNQLSWLIQILPFVEEQALYDQFDLAKNVMGQDNIIKPHESQPQMFLCPSDSARGRFYSSPFTFNRRFGKANYVAYVSPEHVVNMRVYPGALINEEQSLKMFTDGTSKTVMLTEIRTRDVETDQRGAWPIAWNATSLIAFDMHCEAEPTGVQPPHGKRNMPYIPQVTIATIPPLPPNAPPVSASGQGNSDRLRDCPEPNAADLDQMPCSVENTYWISAAPRSLHTGGVNAANVDGSVTWMQNEIDIYLMARMISINDGQTSTEGYSK